MKREVALTVATVAGLLAAGTGPAAAELIIFGFAGVITEVNDPKGFLAGAVGVGSPFSGAYTFESTTPDTNASPRTGVYVDAIVDVAGEIGGVPFGGPLGSSALRALNDFLPTGFDNYSAHADVGLAGQTLIFGLSFRDSSGSVFADDSLPLTPPPFEVFDSATLSIGSPLENFGLGGEVTLLVPEPGSLSLLALAALVVVKRRRPGFPRA